jgi:hypothetical protein
MIDDKTRRAIWNVISRLSYTENRLEDPEIGSDLARIWRWLNAVDALAELQANQEAAP